VPKQKGFARLKFIFIGIGVLILLLVSAILLSFKLNENIPPPELVANFMDVSQIDKISKYRSCVGHTTIPQDRREMKRSMKHYIQVKPEYHKNKIVEIYSPYDGYVSVIRSETDIEKVLEGEIWIIPKRKLPMLPPFGVWQFSVQHIDVRPDLKLGSEVKAGELIGHAAFWSGRGSTFDIVYGKMTPVTKEIDNWRGPFTDLDSIFNHMSDKVLSEYQKKGMEKSRIILSKEERDQNPCIYEGEGPYFIDADNPDNWVILK